MSEVNTYTDEVEVQDSTLNPGEVKIKATDTETKNEACIVYNLGTGLDDAVAKFGGDIVFSFFVRHSKVNAQNAMRTLLRAGKSSDEIQEYMVENWKPGLTVRDPQAQAIKAFESMSVEEKQEFIRLLQERAGA